MMHNVQTTSEPNSNVQREARVDLAAAHREAIKDGFIEGIDNHFSLLVPGSNDRFLLNAFGLHWSEVTASNLIEVNLNGEVVSGRGMANTSAVCIHAPIHRRGINCVLHTHMPFTTALTQLEDMTLEYSSQNALLFIDSIAYDNDYNGFADTMDEGERMADVLGDKKILLLANHGAVSVGKSVAHAYHQLYFLERAAQTQMIAMASGASRRVVAGEVQDKIRRQLKSYGPQSGKSEIELYFDAVKRVLTSEGSDYAS